MFRIDQWKGTKEKRIDLGLVLGAEKNEDAYVVLRELTVGEAIGLKTVEDEKERYTRIAQMLPDLIIDHNFLATEDRKATVQEVSDIVGSNWKALFVLANEFWVFCFFIPTTQES